MQPSKGAWRDSPSMEPVYINESDPDFDLRQCLYDTLILLGGEKHIAEFLKKSCDGSISREEVNEIRRYNFRLIEGVKDRLSNCNHIRSRPVNGGD